MRYYKIIQSGYLAVIGTGNGGTEITNEEYENILTVINEKPIVESGYDYRLKEDLTWETYELPIVEETDISSDELMTMIEGVL